VLDAVFNNAVAEMHVRNGVLVPYVRVNGILREVAWAPMPGAQVAFLQETIFELLFGGPRGNGKSLALIMAFVQHVGSGWGAAWNGLILRQYFPELSNLIRLSRIWIPKIYPYPHAEFNKQYSTWEFWDGAKLRLSYIQDEHDFSRFQGENLTFVGIDELCEFSSIEPLKLIQSSMRRDMPGVIPMLRMTTNTYGRNRDQIMERYRLPIPDGQMLGPMIRDLDDFGNPGEPRRYIHGRKEENLALAFADPTYSQRLRGSTSDPSKLEAWETGRWTQPSASMFGHLFQEYRGYFELPDFDVPRPEEIRFSLDWGSAHPTAVCFWWIDKLGEDLNLPNGRVISRRPGDTHLIDVLYLGKANRGLYLSPTQIGDRIFERIERNRWPQSICRRDGNIADNQIYTDDGRPSIADELDKMGIRFEPAYKGPNSRVQGADRFAQMLAATKPPRENPGLFVCSRCDDFFRTIPNLERSDTNPEDVSKNNQDDHVLDSIRYFLLRENSEPGWSGRIDAYRPAGRPALRLVVG
jgi:hypothetical protein